MCLHSSVDCTLQILKGVEIHKVEGFGFIIYNMLKILILTHRMFRFLPLDPESTHVSKVDWKMICLLIHR